MNFGEFISITIPDGDVSIISSGNTMLWRKLMCNPIVDLKYICTTEYGYAEFKLTVSGISNSLISGCKIYKNNSVAGNQSLSYPDQNGNYGCLFQLEPSRWPSGTSIFIRLLYTDLAGQEKKMDSQTVIIP